MNAVLLAVGALVALEPAAWGDGDPGCVVRVGLTEQRMATLNELAVWQSLARVPQPLDELTDTFFVSEEGRTSPAPADEIAAVVDRLIARGLVIALDLDDPGLVELGMRVRPVPRYETVVDVRPAPGRFAIGFAGAAVVSLSAPQHALWKELDDCRSVTHLAVGIAVRDGADPAQPDMRAAWLSVLDLVRTGAVSVDLALG